MLKNEIYKSNNSHNFTKDYLDISFTFKVNRLPQTIVNDDGFIYDDEILLVNVGEKEKFTSDYIYQSKLTVDYIDGALSFFGYTPDWNRKLDLIKDKDGISSFRIDKEYKVNIRISKYRVYIDINDGQLIDTYGNGRDEIEDIKIYVRDHCDIEIKNVAFKEGNYPHFGYIDEYISKGLFTNYLGYHEDEYGTYFDRVNIIQNIKCTTRNSGQYDSNVMMDFYSNTRSIKIRLMVSDVEIADYPFKLGFLVNREKIEYPLQNVKKGDWLDLEFKVPEKYGEYHRITIFLPVCLGVCVRNIKLDNNALMAPIDKKKTFVFLGDSITEGAECFDPSAHYVNQICLAYNAIGHNFAISGRTFNDYNLLGNYDFDADYIFIANGTNTYCMGVGDKMKVFETLEKDMDIVISSCHKYFPKAKIIGMLPIWRNDENGKDYTLQDVSKKIREVYEKRGIDYIVDCHDFIPFDDKYFSNPQLALHPNSEGHDLYFRSFLKVLTSIIGTPYLEDDGKEAELVLSSNH